MGVFARLFRRSGTSETTEETGTAEAPAGRAQAAGATGDPGTEDGTGTQDAAGTVEPKGSSGTPEAAEPTAKEAGRVAGTETVDIPKQQSSESAGSEAGEGART